MYAIPLAESRISEWRLLFLRSSARWTAHWPCSQSGTVEDLFGSRTVFLSFQQPTDFLFVIYVALYVITPL